ncbi:MAG: hypothetical protein MMC23_000620 [Stictis urceolatum]|nr:hypothetical protein [Stictis urceolata]
MAFGDSRSYRERVADLVDPIHDEEDDIALDGMATLTLNDKEVGYLGSAAGAAFLKYLWRPPSNCAVNDSSNRSSDARPLSKHTVVSMPPSIDSSKLIADPFIDAYFSLFHSIYPLIHEPTFRAAYSEVIPRPGGEAWTALANIVAAIGAFSSMMRCLSIDTPFYFSAKASLSLDCLETGNVTLVQALILMAEYLQKRNKPNSGYTYAGLAKRMAFGLGLHKEFSADGTRPLQLENRRRLWWSIYVIDSSMSVTLSRPVHSINSAEDAALPANIHENHLTPQTEVLPSPDEGWTNYSALRAQASFYIQVRDLYSSAISNAPVDYQRLIDMDAQYTWEKYAFAQAVTLWRLYNLRIIIFRPFILGQSTGNNNKLASTESGQLAQERCLAAARETIKSVSLYWNLHARTRLACWHALYFLFQAVLIPISCLRQTPEIQAAALWKADIRMALDVVEEMHFIHSSKCAAVMHQLADPFLGSMATTPDLNAKSNIKGRSDLLREAVLERGSANLDFVSMNFQDLLQGTSPGQTQGEDAWQIMWPGVPTMESDVTMEEYTGFFPSSQPDTFGVGSAEPNTSDYC